MKKILILVVVAIAAVSTTVSCNGVADGGKPSTSVDTLSMALGEMYGYGMKEEFSRRDTTFNKADFMRGFEMAVNIDTTQDSYRQGVMVGAQIVDMFKNLRQQGVEINQLLLVQEFKRAMMSDSAVSPMALQGRVNMLMQKEMQAAKERNPKAIANKEAGKLYIDSITENDPEVKVTESGLAYKVVKAGNGTQFKTTDRVMTKYKGMKADGKVFDEAKEARAMSPMSVVPGFREAMLMMSPGASYIIYIPGELAYGVDGRAPVIEPNELLVFEIETVGLEPAKAKK